MKELVVLSGKGGTGKTSLVASFAALTEHAVLADCDVDAADLHLVLAPEIRHRETFQSGAKAVIRPADCTSCGACLTHCRFEAIRRTNDGATTFSVDPLACEGCGVCAEVCPAKAIDLRPSDSGEWYISDTRCGPMVHARLGIAEENSGRLVTVVRKRAAGLASALAAERGLGLVIIDGPPGIGCPVIASLGGTSLALIVTEPTVSGLHDMERVAQLAAHFKVPTMICINKCDLNPDMAETIRRRAAQLRMWVAGEIPYGSAFTRAQIAGRSVVEFDGGGEVAREIARMWNLVLEVLDAAPTPS